jgi:hypothetical protein
MSIIGARSQVGQWDSQCAQTVAIAGYEWGPTIEAHFGEDCDLDIVGEPGGHTTPWPARECLIFSDVDSPGL